MTRSPWECIRYGCRPLREKREAIVITFRLAIALLVLPPLTVGSRDKNANPVELAYAGRTGSEVTGSGQPVGDETTAGSLGLKDANSYVTRGIAYGRRKQYDRAIDAFTTAIREKPSFAS